MDVVGTGARGDNWMGRNGVVRCCVGVDLRAGVGQRALTHPVAPSLVALVAAPGANRW
jgi:hypothetical protein